MNAYQIADLERLTGIKANTIRVWERRYKLIVPGRTSTNIRYYDDAQARKLLNVASLLASGVKISKIAALSDRQINERIKALLGESPDDIACSAFINDLAAAMLVFDEAAFEKIFSSAVIRLGFFKAITKVIYPLLRKIGLMWSVEDALPVQEHFASSIIRRKLLAAIDGLPAASRKSKLFLLFLPTEEWHEIGLLLSDYIIRSQGYRTIYLGQSVPGSNLSAVVKATNPTHLFTLYTSRRSPEGLKRDIQQMAKDYPDREIWVSSVLDIHAVVKRMKHVTVLGAPEDLIKLL